MSCGRTPRTFDVASLIHFVLPPIILIRWKSCLLLGLTQQGRPAQQRDFLCFFYSLFPVNGTGADTRPTESQAVVARYKLALQLRPGWEKGFFCLGQYVDLLFKSRCACACAFTLRMRYIETQENTARPPPGRHASIFFSLASTVRERSIARVRARNSQVIRILMPAPARPPKR